MGFIRQRLGLCLRNSGKTKSHMSVQHKNLIANCKPKHSDLVDYMLPVSWGFELFRQQAI